MKEKLIAAVRRRMTPILFVASSLTLTAADFIFFNFFQYTVFPGNEFVSVLAGRIVGAIIGFFINRSIVFKSADGRWKVETTAFIKYAALWTVNYLLASLAVTFMVDNLHVEARLAWMIAGLLLYAPNYLLQRHVVFRKKQAT
jgi:putative flippase GtrA